MEASNFSPDFLDQVAIILEKGGIMMIPLMICSFVVMLVIIERLFSLRKNRIVSSSSLKKWETWLANGMNSEEIPGLNPTSLVGSILFSLSEHLPMDKTRLEERTEELARREKHRLENGLVYLDTIAGIAPLFGLLGTALGMVEVFSRLSAVGEAKMSALSSGISQALFTTVTGLCIGIPSLVAFNLFSRHIEKILIMAEEQLNSLIDRYYNNFVKKQG